MDKRLIRYLLALCLGVIIVNFSACGDTEEGNIETDAGGDTAPEDSDDDSKSEGDSGDEDEDDSDDDEDKDEEESEDSDEEEENEDKDVTSRTEDDSDDDDDDDEEEEENDDEVNDDDDDKDTGEEEDDDDEEESEKDTEENDETDKDTEDDDDDSTDDEQQASDSELDTEAEGDCPGECITGCRREGGTVIEEGTCPNVGELCCDLESTDIETDTGEETKDTSEDTEDTGEDTEDTGEDTEDTGGGNTGGFCPTNGDPCIILPFGDSITDGMGTGASGGGYRVELFRRANQNSQSITFGGRQQNGPNDVDGVPFPRNHEGYPGITVGDLNGQHVPVALTSAGPHIILLHIGTNDMYGSDPGGASGRLETLVDNILSTTPDALLAVSSIIPIGMGSDVNSYNSAIPGIVEERAQQGANIIYVDQNSTYPANEMPDGVHPNDAGYNHMGGVWYEAIKQYLP